MQHQQSAFAVARCETHYLASTSGRNPGIKTPRRPSSAFTRAQCPSVRRAWRTGSPRQPVKSMCTTSGAVRRSDDSSLDVQTPPSCEADGQLRSPQNRSTQRSNGSVAADDPLAAADDGARNGTTASHAGGGCLDSGTAKGAGDNSSLADGRIALESSGDDTESSAPGNAASTSGSADEHSAGRAVGDASDADDDEDTEFGSEEPSDDEVDELEPRDLSTTAAGFQDVSSTVLERVRDCTADQQLYVDPPHAKQLRLTPSFVCVSLSSLLDAYGVPPSRRSKILSWPCIVELSCRAGSHCASHGIFLTGQKQVAWEARR